MEERCVLPYADSATSFELSIMKLKSIMSLKSILSMRRALVMSLM